MNIVIVTTLFPIHDIKNKNTKADYYLAKEWIKAGHNVVVLFAESDLFYRRGLRVLKEHYFYDEISVYHISYPRFIPKRQDPFLLTQKQIRKWADSSLADSLIGKVDLFYCDFPAGNWTLIEYLKKRRDYSKSIFVPVFNNCDFFSKSKVKKILINSKTVGVRSRDMAKRINAYNLNSNPFIVYSGVPKTQNPVSEAKVNEGKKPTKIIYVGDFIPLKNVDILIQSFSVLNSKHSDLSLALIGDGPEENKLRELVASLNLMNSVSFLGRLTRDKVFEEMLECDIFVMVSSPESFGIVYIEAMAAGCCVVGCLD